MSNAIIGLSIDAADAAALAGFWAEALGRQVAAGADEGPSRTGCTLTWPPPTGRPRSAG
jgi:hypothetical protein